MFGLNKSQDAIGCEGDTEQDSPHCSKPQRDSIRRRHPHKEQRKRSLVGKIQQSPLVSKKKPRKNAESDTPSSPISPTNTSSSTRENIDFKDRRSSAENPTEKLNYPKIDFVNRNSTSSTEIPNKKDSSVLGYTNKAFSEEDIENSENQRNNKPEEKLYYPKLRWETVDGKTKILLVEDKSSNTEPYKQPKQEDRRDSNASVFYSNLSTAKSPYVNTYSGSDSKTKFRY